MGCRARTSASSGRRAELEDLAAELAASRITDQQLERLQEAWRKYEASADPLTQGQGTLPGTQELWAEAGDAFHATIVAASGNYFLGESITQLSRRLPRNSAFAAYAGSSRLLRQNWAEHRAIATRCRRATPLPHAPR